MDKIIDLNDKSSLNKDVSKLKQILLENGIQNDKINKIITDYINCSIPKKSKETR